MSIFAIREAHEAVLIALEEYATTAIAHGEAVRRETETRFAKNRLRKTLDDARARHEDLIARAIDPDRAERRE